MSDKVVERVLTAFADSGPEGLGHALEIGSIGTPYSDFQGSLYMNERYKADTYRDADFRDYGLARAVRVILNHAKDLSAALTELQALRRIVPSHEGVREWRPIETAPKDGTLVLLYNVAHGEQAVMGWTNDLGMPDSFPEGCWTDAGGLNRAINLTVNGGYYQFWQPLPAPPASPSKQASASADQGGE